MRRHHAPWTAAVTATLCAATALLLPSAASARGRIEVVYEQPPNADLEEVIVALREEGLFEEVASVVTETVTLPRNLDVVFGNCGTANAFYRPGEHTIVMCYEMMQLLLGLLAEEDLSDEELETAFVGSVLFFLLHEMGHALVHVLELPITGKEEDAVDDLATLILLDEGEEGVDAVFGAVISFAAMAEAFEVGELPFWDEHSLHSQRFYGIACLIYGSDPQNHGFMVGADGLPPERAERCPSEFQQKYNAWERLMEPYYVGE